VAKTTKQKYDERRSLAEHWWQASGEIWRKNAEKRQAALSRRK